MRILILVLCFFYICNTAQSEVTPVLIWGFNNITNNFEKGLRTLSDVDFVNEIVFPLLEDHLIIVFLEKNLLTRDFQCRLPQNNTPCFKALQNIEKRMFFPQVKHPMHRLLPYAYKHQISIDGNLDLEIDCFHKSLHLISFTEMLTTERETQLQQHDFLMSQLGERYKDCSAVYIYMSAEPTQSERKDRAPVDTDLEERQFENSTVENNSTDNAMYLYFDEYFAIAFKKIILQKTYDSGEVEEEELQVVNMVTNKAVKQENVHVNLQLISGHQIVFLVLHDGAQSYQINQMYYDHDFYETSGMDSALSAPPNFSFFCESVKLSKNEYDIIEIGVVGEALLWENLQFQITLQPAHSDKPNSTFDKINSFDVFYRQNVSPQKFKFYPAWSCTGVFTAGSLMGTVILLLLSVSFAVGLCAMLNIDSPPRFEDPRVPAFEGGT